MGKEITIEQMIAVIMTMKKLLGEFSVDMYYNDLAEPNERYVVKFKVHEPAPDSSRTAEYFRCSSFKEGLNELWYFLMSKNNTMKYQPTEIIDIVALEKYDSYGNPISVRLEDIELIPDVKEDNCPKIDWEQRRYELAKAIISERVASADCIRAHYLAITAIEIADELISILKK